MSDYPDFYTLGEIVMFASPAIARAPIYCMPCDGRLLKIVDYTSLFAILGNTYGGDSQTTFGVPDFRGVLPFGADGGNYKIGYRYPDSFATNPGPVAAGTIAQQNLPSLSGQVTIAEQKIALPLKATTASGTGTPANQSILGSGGAGQGSANIYVPQSSATSLVSLDGGQATIPASNVNASFPNDNKPVEFPLPVLSVGFFICYAGIFPTPYS
ncbi:microcystin-dependent protein [Sphingomonas sp. SORGH_AS870]|uniref:phage tail protein n=1 Tax=Sphingomonas sp. SORGH_AS_0870 TaxID=3041801 RepID=UPI002862C531|nr:phage tail protein [Sphingomonas sp. SORGH_AS_0870]MDR6147842.1 microcystin-dependent protein [Sphingomonas sp. SORGH_AS_0870]